MRQLFWVEGFLMQEQDLTAVIQSNSSAFSSNLRVHLLNYLSFALITLCAKVTYDIVFG